MAVLDAEDQHEEKHRDHESFEADGDAQQRPNVMHVACRAVGKTSPSAQPALPAGAPPSGHGTFRPVATSTGRSWLPYSASGISIDGHLVHLGADAPRCRRRSAGSTSGTPFDARGPCPRRVSPKLNHAPVLDTTSIATPTSSRPPFPGDALAVHHVELGDAGRHLVLHDLDPHAVADRLGAGLDRLDPPDVEANAGVELERAATGSRSPNDTDLLAELVRRSAMCSNDTAPVSLRSAWLMSRAWMPTNESPISPSISARGTSAATDRRRRHRCRRSG